MTTDSPIRDESVLLTLTQELAEVSRLVDDDDVPTTLERFVIRLRRTVPGCEHVTISVREQTADGPVLRTVAGLVETGGVRAIDAGLAANPISEALDHGEPRRLEDTASDERWLGFSAELTEAGFRSAVVLPVPTTRDTPAVLTLFSREPHRFDDTVYDMVLLLVLHAGVVFDNAQLFHDSRSLIDQLRTALSTRERIGRAQGVVMQRLGLDADTAFDRLKRASQNRNTKLREVATTVLAGHAEQRLDEVLAELAIA